MRDFRPVISLERTALRAVECRLRPNRTSVPAAGKQNIFARFPRSPNFCDCTSALPGRTPRHLPGVKSDIPIVQPRFLPRLLGRFPLQKRRKARAGRGGRQLRRRRQLPKLGFTVAATFRQRRCLFSHPGDISQTFASASFP